jgi:hypothetical protein
MDNVTFETIIDKDGIEWSMVKIDRGDGSFTSMSKEHYDTLVSELPDAATKKAK